MRSGALNAIFLIALYAYSMPGSGQNSLKNDLSTATCIAAKEWVNTDLFGAWSLLLEGAGSSVVTRLQLQRNPEFAESLAGSYAVGEKKFEVFGDIEEGALDLEETHNGQDISAIWKGRVAEGSCGQTILGTRRRTADNAEQSFVLRRPGW
jgi:hypothetical protein